MSLLILEQLKSINLKKNCLFCLENCEGNKSYNVSEHSEQLRLLLSCTGKGFSNFFWESLIGAPKKVAFPPVCKQENVENLGEMEEEMEGEDGSTNSWLSLCSNCLKVVQKVKDLHSKLEAIQLLLVDQISSIQRLIKSSSSKVNLLRLGGTGWREENVNKLCNFQDAVVAKSQKSYKIPLVYLEKFNPVVTDCKDVIIGLIGKNNIVPPTLKKNGAKPPPSTSILAFTRDASHIKEEDFDTDWSPEGLSEEDDDDDYKPVTEGRPRKRLNLEIGSCDSGTISKRRRGRPRSEGVKIGTRTQQKVKRIRGRPARSSKFSTSEGSKSCSRDSLQDKAKCLSKNYILKRRQQAPDRAVRTKMLHRIFTCEFCGKVYLQKPAYELHKLAHKRSPPEEQLDGIQEPIECEICNVTFDCSEYYSHLLLHEVPNATKDFPCSHTNCGRKFQIEENLKIHIEVDHDEKSLTSQLLIKKCDVCNICFESCNHLRDHIKRAHKGYISSLLYCRVCSYCCTTNENLISHMHSHSHSDEQVCFLCNSNCNGRVDLLEHFQREHNLLTSATCSFCQEEFLDPYLREVHMRMEHKSKDIYICCYCGKKCYFLVSLIEHINTHDRTQKTDHNCSDCNEYFRNENKLAQHRVKVHGAPKVSCEICGNEYVTPNGLSMHMKEHSKEAYHCKICDKYYGAKSRYDDHMRSLHSDERKFACELCGFTCKTSGVLSRHRLTHTKPFVCNVCDRSFARRFTLNSHMNMHTGSTFVCHICGYEFHNRKSCTAHVKKYHTGDNPMPLYKPQKRRRPRLTWKDTEGNVVIAKNASLYVDPSQLLKAAENGRASESVPETFENIPKTENLSENSGGRNEGPHLNVYDDKMLSNNM
ncbi:unnamed protein product [Orchesella dallaii]|uniref:C2H2-type domain-containing protein n=1 Tax=Orchesella dallaii TaxID=48710 RepID=A0ABP1QX21_9HEXA